MNDDRESAPIIKTKEQLESIIEMQTRALKLAHESIKELNNTIKELKAKNIEQRKIIKKQRKQIDGFKNE